jgi:hypothetical protein
MKIRKGFVSNSSSSSFIIGVGKIKEDKVAEFKKWYNDFMRRNGFDSKDAYQSYRMRIRSTIDICQGDNYYCEGDVEHGDKSISVVAPVNSEPSVSISFDSTQDDEYFIVCLGNDEGDTCFWDGYDLRYDKVDADWFTGYQKELLEKLQNTDEVFEESNFRIGAYING